MFSGVPSSINCHIFPVLFFVFFEAFGQKKGLKENKGRHTAKVYSPAHANNAAITHGQCPETSRL